MSFIFLFFLFFLFTYIYIYYNNYYYFLKEIPKILYTLFVYHLVCFVWRTCVVFLATFLKVRLTLYSLDTLSVSWFFYLLMAINPRTRPGFSWAPTRNCAQPSQKHFSPLIMNYQTFFWLENNKQVDTKLCFPKTMFECRDTCCIITLVHF